MRKIAGNCGGVECETKTEKYAECIRRQKEPDSQESQKKSESSQQFLIAVCAKFTGIPSEKFFPDAFFYSPISPGNPADTIAVFATDVISRTPPPINIHPSISTTVLRI
jgi:hypothetical protein